MIAAMVDLAENVNQSIIIRLVTVSLFVPYNVKTHFFMPARVPFAAAAYFWSLGSRK